RSLSSRHRQADSCSSSTAPQGRPLRLPVARRRSSCRCPSAVLLSRREFALDLRTKVEKFIPPDARLPVIPDPLKLLDVVQVTFATRRHFRINEPPAPL